MLDPPYGPAANHVCHPKWLIGHSRGTKENPILQNAPMYSYIPAKDVTRARNFYEQKLGFTPKQETAGGVVYEFGKGTACFLYPTPNAGTSQASQAFWQVDDIQREVAELKARGVKFEKYDMPTMNENNISTDHGAKAAWFKDTEGNIMALIQSV
ncbi:MAG: VOC family protein [Burkholderiales bacterium]